ncbi:tRNA-specific adenosine deaminase TAD2-like isoform X2 [Eucalyptus grandis]|uniref:tRNA-specific adenosine deaminase TAD2-like isoform X2 n=1 Tax=Eucalyptus grandis TaxID=71139 RepID=UPI00192EDAE7|nr:tRNA-specific adenosine deaminase TAD2-like isoform X2 [Eucalyptus grandis]
MEFPLLRVNDSLLSCLIVEEVHLTATGRNSTNETGNATRHGEMEALDVFIEERTGFSSAEVAEKFSACSLYVTCESCIMCAAAKSIIGNKTCRDGHSSCSS